MTQSVPSVSVATAHTGAANKTNELGMRPMQERAWAKRGEQYLLIKAPPASGKSRALMFIALDKCPIKACGRRLWRCRRKPSAPVRFSLGLDSAAEVEPVQCARRG